MTFYCDEPECDWSWAGRKAIWPRVRGRHRATKHARTGGASALPATPSIPPIEAAVMQLAAEIAEREEVIAKLKALYVS